MRTSLHTSSHIRNVNSHPPTLNSQASTSNSQVSSFKSQLSTFRSQLSDFKSQISTRPSPSWLPRAYTRWLPFLHDGAIVNTLDRDQLYSAIPLSSSAPPHLRGLMHHLARATPVPPMRIPPDLVTMNTIVRLRIAPARELAPRPTPPATEAIELVYPFDADRMPLARSITAPLGAALFGKRVGDNITWPTPAGPAHATIEALDYQPEREGHYDR